MAVPLLLACDGDGDLPTAPTNVTTVVAKSNFTFSPPWTAVPQGTMVTFQFEAIAHSVSFSAVLGSPANIGSSVSSSVTRVFTTKGQFNYTCTIHPFMTGRVTVQ